MMNASIAGSPLAPSMARAGASGAARRREAQAPQQPVEIVEAIANTGGMRVAQQIVAAIDVQLSAHGLGQVRKLVSPVDQLDHAPRERRVDRREHAVHARLLVEDDALRPGLVWRRAGDRIFEQVRERTVTQIVQQRSRQRLSRRDRGLPADPRGARRESPGGARGAAS